MKILVTGAAGFIGAYCSETIGGKEAEKEYLPMQPGDVYQTYADTTALQREMGYKPAKGV